MLIIPFRPPWLISLAGTKLVDCVGRHVCRSAQNDQAVLFTFKLALTRADNDRLRSIEQLLKDILLKMDSPEEVSTAPNVASVQQCVASEAAKFPAIEKAILFGSIARSDAGPQSDVDLRLVLDRSKQFSLYDLARLQKALEKRLSREVDIITADTLKNLNLAMAIKQEGITIYKREGK